MLKAWVTFPLVLAVVLGGCTSFNVQNDYSLDPSSKKGLLVLSFTAETEFQNLVLQYREINTGSTGEITLFTYQNPLDWNMPRGRLATIELPTGQYEIFNWATPMGDRSVKEFSIPFSIVAGKATYIGNVHFAFLKKTKLYQFRVTDMSSRDLPLLFQRYPNLGQNDVIRATSDIEI
jgi:hypothetical protein